MVRVRVTRDGFESLVRELPQIGDRVTGSLQPVMQIIAEDWVSTMQERIRKGELELPPMHPVTKAIRRHYGHDSAPRLVRGGDLLHSIVPLSVEERGLEVGSAYPFADELHGGGTTTDPHGRTVDLPAHPFVVLTDQMFDDAVDMVADYVMEGDTHA